ncbi:hypothetical protein KPSA3_03962 [Pseudomonas syringae pv. actinidiae]|uniref:Uncharacterized protein n=1 Tax=Pseudomonas syringae pv. actinidiae TaxID=103796 RepID=A0AAN4TLP4_PSESF|nr:hypothetical protein KPSA3_03962 [Pseudomonas syringae pv. actinidiae]
MRSIFFCSPEWDRFPNRITAKTYELKHCAYFAHCFLRLLLAGSRSYGYQ